MTNIYKENLHNKRIKLGTAFGSNTFEAANRVNIYDDTYLSFLDTAADLEVTLRTENWENADEISDTLLTLDPKFKGKKHYAIIVYKLLEEADV